MDSSECRYVLVSDALDTDQRETIQAIVQSSGGRWAILEANQDTDVSALPLDDIDVVYVSVDVLGESSKSQLTPLMALFCEIALKAPRLRWLQASSAGLDRPQYQSLLQRGVALTHAGGVAAKTVAHSAIAGLLALGRKLPDFMALQGRKQWAPARGADAPHDLSGQTAIVVGLGAIGQEIARLCQALDLHVIGFNRSGTRPSALDIATHPVSELDGFLHQADWVILSCPLTEETRHLIGEIQLRSLKPSAHLVDVSRGGVVDSASLLDALQRRELMGAYLDVFETEPLPADSPFWTLPNTIVTPHAAGDSSGRGRKLTTLFIDNLKRYIAAQPLINEAKRQ